MLGESPCILYIFIKHKPTLKLIQCGNYNQLKVIGRYMAYTVGIVIHVGNQFKVFKSIVRGVYTYIAISDLKIQPN